MEEVFKVRHHTPHRGARIAVGLRDIRGVRAAKDDENFQRVDAKALAGAFRCLLERRERRRDEVPELLFLSAWGARAFSFASPLLPLTLVSSPLPFFFGVSFFSFAGSSVKRNGPTESCTRSSSPNCISAPTRRKPIKIKMSRMMPITFSAVNRPPPSFYASRGFYALRGQCSPFSGMLPSFFRHGAGVEDRAVLRHAELTVGLKTRHLRQLLERTQVEVAQELFSSCGTASAVPAPANVRTPQ